MEKNLPDDLTSHRLLSWLCFDYGWGLLRRRWFGARPMVKRLLLAQLYRSGTGRTSLFTHPRYIRAIAYYGFIVAAIDLAFVFLSDTPLLEWFTVFTALGYVGLMAYNMTKYPPVWPQRALGILRQRETVEGFPLPRIVFHVELALCSFSAYTDDPLPLFLMCSF